MFVFRRLNNGKIFVHVYSTMSCSLVEGSHDRRRSCYKALQSITLSGIFDIYGLHTNSAEKPKFTNSISGLGLSLGKIGFWSQRSGIKKKSWVLLCAYQQYRPNQSGFVVPVINKGISTVMKIIWHLTVFIGGNIFIAPRRERIFAVYMPVVEK